MTSTSQPEYQYSSNQLDHTYDYLSTSLGSPSPQVISNAYYGNAMRLGNPTMQSHQFSNNSATQ